MTVRILPAGHFVGIDVGTSACKTVLVDDRGTVAATRSASYPTRRTPQGEVTQDPIAWLRAASSTIRGCLADIPGARVAAISVTAPAHVGVLVDRDGQPLARALLAFDGRPDAVAASLRETLGDAFFDRTFVELTAGWTFAQLVWLRQELGAGVWRRVRNLVLQKDYVRLSMTGELATDHSDAAGTAMVDQRSRAWDAELCALAHLRVDQMPPIRSALDVGGGLSPSWARRTGIPAGTPVVVGATDTPTELLSIGAVEPASTIVKIASTGTIVAVTAEPRPDRRLLTYPHAVPGRWYSAAATSTAATAYNWCCGILWPRGTTVMPAYRRLESKLRRVPPGAEGLLFLPFLNGERTPHWDSRLRGAFLGLSAGHRSDHFLRAVMEGVCLSLRDCLEAMRRAGLAVDHPTFTGGGVASPLWRRILAASLGLAGRTVSPHGPAIGAALLAQTATSGRSPKPRARRVAVVPPPEWVATYDRLYDVYRDATRSLADVSHRLTAAAASGRR